ncbi:MAG: glycosyltransferase family 39 protein [Acidobacteriota bacterium]
MPAPRYYRMGLMVLIGAFVGFRLWGLTDSCLWFDEIFSVHAAEHSWSSLFAFVARDMIHPPLFYAALKIWIAVGGEGLFWLRLLPVLLAAIAVIPFLLLCKEICVARSATVLALAFLAVNGSAIKYSQEVRMYSLLLCLSLFSIWLFFRFFERGTGIFALTAVNVLLVYCHYFGWLVVVTEILAVVIFQRAKIKQIAGTSTAVALAFLPWVWLVSSENLTASDVQQNLGWIAKPGVGDIVNLAFGLIEPFYYPQSGIDPESHLYITLPILVILAASICVGLLDLKAYVGNKQLQILGMFAVVPAVVMFVLSWLFPVSIWGTRHLTIVFGPVVILSAVVVTRLRPPGVRYASFGLLSLLLVFSFVERLRADRPLYVWCAWERLEPIIGGTSNDNAPQKLYVFEDLVAYHFWFAGRYRSNLEIVKVDGVPEMTEDKAYFLPRGFDGVGRSTEMSGDHFWIAFRDMKWDERHPPLNILLAEGYKIGPPQTIEADGLKAFLVEVRQ